MVDVPSGPTVLVVDDEPAIALLVQDTLEEAGFTVLVADGFAAALEALEAAAPGLAGLITDVNLGKGCPTGWAVATRARELMPAVPVIYVTGDSSHQWPSAGVPQSVVIAKPFAPAQIIVALANLMNQTDPSAAG